LTAPWAIAEVPGRQNEKGGVLNTSFDLVGELRSAGDVGAVNPRAHRLRCLQMLSDGGENHRVFVDVLLGVTQEQSHRQTLAASLADDEPAQFYDEGACRPTRSQVVRLLQRSKEAGRTQLRRQRPCMLRQLHRNETVRRALTVSPERGRERGPVHPSRGGQRLRRHVIVGQQDHGTSLGFVEIVSHRRQFAAVFSGEHGGHVQTGNGRIVVEGLVELNGERAGSGGRGMKYQMHQ
jgi:hypothetical protein